ncbi:MAG TPA: hypothetical protein VGX69_13225 [Solirubrobacteraceae bacterium]|jgi:hypothetical protein|nr:hypothetical protein [Solirubrobacteraceae bacterium]
MSQSIFSRVRAALPRTLAAAATGLATVALLACGGSSSPTSAAASEQSKERASEAKLADFARCMREHGVNASTSTGPGGQGFGLKVSGKSGAGPQTMEAAQRACKRYQPDPKKIDLSPQEKVAHEEAVLKFAKCMREHGIEVHASSAGGGVQIQIHPKAGSAGPNPESPAFQSAQKACQDLLPFKGPGPGGGPSKSSTGGEQPSGAGLATGG